MKEKNLPELLRILTVKDAVGIGLGAIIGAGIFMVTGVAAGVAGPTFICKSNDSRVSGHI